MKWTANIQATVFQNGELQAAVIYSDADGSPSFVEVERSKVQNADWPDAPVRARLTALNAVDISKITVGAPKPAPGIVVPTQAQIDRDVWLAALKDWKSKKAAVDGGLTKSITQVDVDAAYAIVKATYKDEYGVYL